jgi:hypothetical protein
MKRYIIKNVKNNLYLLYDEKNNKYIWVELEQAELYYTRTAIENVIERQSTGWYKIETIYEIK